MRKPAMTARRLKWLFTWKGEEEKEKRWSLIGLLNPLVETNWRWPSRRAAARQAVLTSRPLAQPTQTYEATVNKKPQKYRRQEMSGGKSTRRLPAAGFPPMANLLLLLLSLLLRLPQPASLTCGFSSHRGPRLGLSHRPLSLLRISSSWALHFFPSLVRTGCGRNIELQRRPHSRRAHFYFVTVSQKRKDVQQLRKQNWVQPPRSVAGGNSTPPRSITAGKSPLFFL